MKIGIYDPYLDDLGGGEKYMMTIASCLVDSHDVSIFWDNKHDIDAVATRFSLNLDHVQIVPNVFSKRTSAVERFFKTKVYDAIIVLSDGSIPLTGAKKLFLHIQQPLMDMQVHSLFDKLKLSRVTGVFCNSLYTKSYIDKKFSLSPTVIYPPVDVSAKKIAKKNIILHVGRFRSVNGADYKKQAVMMQAFKQMIDRGLKNWKFIVATGLHEKDMTEFEIMKKTAKGYPITFLVNQSNAKLWQIYSEAKIYWHASGYGEDLARHPELAEHFGISTVEAMGAGVVPVVINAGGQKEIVTEGENGMLWNSLEELEDKTQQLINENSLREKLSKNAIISSQKYNREQFCNAISNLLT